MSKVFAIYSMINNIKSDHITCKDRKNSLDNVDWNILPVIIGKQFFPRYYRLQVNPATPRERRVQAHLELAELVEDPRRAVLVMRKSETQLAFCCLGIGIERSSDRIFIFDNLLCQLHSPYRCRAVTDPFATHYILLIRGDDVELFLENITISVLGIRPNFNSDEAIK
ncbi:hypothetical protein NQ317_012086 [Molorchus minor]|uniref:Uncharacterized protein n=1 Tax=Molorchus minor TaxID=1323400 RepID=A0ABQ9JLS8_9CUCU|nr:hypothetical protein NQ317_012086 [Molorchus minor]